MTNSSFEGFSVHSVHSGDPTKSSSVFICAIKDRDFAILIFPSKHVLKFKLYLYLYSDTNSICILLCLVPCVPDHQLKNYRIKSITMPRARSQVRGLSVG